MTLPGRRPGRRSGAVERRSRRRRSHRGSVRGRGAAFAAESAAWEGTMDVRRRLATTLTVGLLLAGCTTAGGDGGRAAAPAATETRRDRALTGSSFDRIPEIVREVQPSVVTISTGDGLGSGVVYDSKGIIVTNEHVVRGARNVEVAFADGRRTPGRVRAADVLTDLALVQVHCVKGISGGTVS